MSWLHWKFHWKKGDMKMKLVESILTNNPCYKAGRKIPAKGTVEAVKKATVTQAPSAIEEMAVSDRGVELIAKFESCRLTAYKSPAGVWPIGYGHTDGVTAGQTLSSEEEAKALLKEDLKIYGGYVNNCVKKGLIRFTLNQNQFDALTSFCCSCGNESLQRLVSGRDGVTVADKILAYNKGGGVVLPGLVRCRKEERKLFLSKCNTT